MVRLDSAKRFAARARARRLTTWRPLLVGLAVIGVLAGAAWVVLASSLLVVREVQVVGLDRVEEAAVSDLAAASLGEPLATVDTRQIADRVGELTLVSSADVVRVWPSTLEVRLTERVPVAAVPAAGGGVQLVDVDGVALLERAEPPADLPVVNVDVQRAGVKALRATLRVLESLPPELAAEIEQVGADSPDSVRMRLRSGPSGEGAEVIWGNGDDNELKAQVLQVMRAELPVDPDADPEADPDDAPAAEPVSVYDVSAPTNPVTR